MTTPPFTCRYQMVDLAAEFEANQRQLASAMLATMRQGTFILGPQVAAFERAFAVHVGAQDVVGVGSGTDALVMALLAAGIGDGQSVVTTPFTFVATIEAIRRVGARPVLADIDSRSLNLDVSSAAASCDANTTAILTVVLFGNTSGLTALKQLSVESGLTLIEDAAQAVGAQVGGRAAGTVGDFGAFSFHPTKSLGAAGDGGAVACSTASGAVIRELRNHGSVDKISYQRRGFNSRLDELQAAILNVKLALLTERVRARQRNAATYLTYLAELPLELPHTTDALARHGYNYFTVQDDRRDDLRAHLAAHQIASAVYYKTPIHLLEAYADLGYGPGDFPRAERAATRCLSLPCHPSLSTKDIEHIASIVRRFYE